MLIRPNNCSHLISSTLPIRWCENFWYPLKTQGKSHGLAKNHNFVLMQKSRNIYISPSYLVLNDYLIRATTNETFHSSINFTVYHNEAHQEYCFTVLYGLLGRILEIRSIPPSINVSEGILLVRLDGGIAVLKIRLNIMNIVNYNETLFGDKIIVGLLFYYKIGPRTSILAYDALYPSSISVDFSSNPSLNLINDYVYSYEFNEELEKFKTNLHKEYSSRCSVDDYEETALQLVILLNDRLLIFLKNKLILCKTHKEIGVSGKHFVVSVCIDPCFNDTIWLGGDQISKLDFLARNTAIISKQPVVGDCNKDIFVSELGIISHYPQLMYFVDEVTQSLKILLISELPLHVLANVSLPQCTVKQHFFPKPKVYTVNELLQIKQFNGIEDSTNQQCDVQSLEEIYLRSLKKLTADDLDSAAKKKIDANLLFVFAANLSVNKSLRSHSTIVYVDYPTLQKLIAYSENSQNLKVCNKILSSDFSQKTLDTSLMNGLAFTFSLSNLNSNFCINEGKNSVKDHNELYSYPVLNFSGCSGYVELVKRFLVTSCSTFTYSCKVDYEQLSFANSEESLLSMSKSRLINSRVVNLNNVCDYIKEYFTTLKASSSANLTDQSISLAGLDVFFFYRLIEPPNNLSPTSLTTAKPICTCNLFNSINGALRVPYTYLDVDLLSTIQLTPNIEQKLYYITNINYKDYSRPFTHNKNNSIFDKPDYDTCTGVNEICVHQNHDYSLEHDYSLREIEPYSNDFTDNQIIKSEPNELVITKSMIEVLDTNWLLENMELDDIIISQAINPVIPTVMDITKSLRKKIVSKAAHEQKQNNMSCLNFLDYDLSDYSA